MITKEPMSALERRTVGSLALLYSFRMLGLFMVLPLLALYVGEMPGATPTLIGLCLGIYGLTQAFLQIPLGWLSDKIGRKPIILGGLAIFAVGSVVAATADSVYAVIVGRMLQGTGAIASTIMALVADLTRVEQRTKAMALVGISIGTSFALAMIVGPAVATLGGLAAVFWFTAALAVTGIVVVLTLVPTPQTVAAGNTESGLNASLIGRSLRNPTLARLNVGVFTLHFTLMASFLVVPGFLEQSLGVDRSQHWQIYLPILLLSLLGMAPMMRIAERGGHLHQMFLLGIGLVISAILLLGLTSSHWVFYTGLWLFFVGFNYLEATLPSLVSKTVSPEGKGTAMGVYSTCQFMGAFVGGASGGWVQGHFGVPALIAMCLLLLAFWWLLVLSGGEFILLEVGSPSNP